MLVRHTDYCSVMLEYAYWVGVASKYDVAELHCKICDNAISMPVIIKQVTSMALHLRFNDQSIVVLMREVKLMSVQILNGGSTILHISV
jgi:hypothetical protein